MGVPQVDTVTASAVNTIPLWRTAPSILGVRKGAVFAVMRREQGGIHVGSA